MLLCLCVVMNVCMQACTHTWEYAPWYPEERESNTLELEMLPDMGVKN